MNRYRISEHLFLDEVVPVGLYDEYAKSNKLYKLAYRVNRQLLEGFEMLRVEMNTPAIINNWWTIYVRSGYDAEKTYNIVEENKSLYQWSGFRSQESSDYSKNSLHNFWKAFDPKWGSVKNNKKAQDLVRRNWKEYNITAMEVRNGWSHIDVRFIPNQKNLMIF